MSILKVGMYASQSTASNYLTLSSDAPFSIKFNQKSWDGVLEYSVDAENWYEWDASEINSADNTLYLRGSGNSYITGQPAVNNPADYSMQITATDGVECTDNIMSLLNHANPDNAVMGYGAFASLFFEQDKLITSPELPATVLANYCYANMFRGTGIEVAPELPAMQLAWGCYSNMFYACSNLTNAPELPATVLANYCYANMFRGTGIEVAPELPVTQLAPYCYQNMFYGCTNLVTAPDLPATALDSYCYAQMFRGTGITVAPELPATVLANYCYNGMFRGTGIAISETQTGAYQTPWRIPSVGTIASEPTGWNRSMLLDINGTFTDDPDINTTYYQAGEPEPADEYITFSSDAPFSISFTAKYWDGVLEYSPDTQNWYEWDASEISSVGNVLYLRGSGNSYITGTSAVGEPAYAMQITATDGVECAGNIMSLLDHDDVDNAVMEAGAFAAMFFNCTSLTTAPELPATTLADYCYDGMFYGTGIVVAPELPATELADYCYYGMFYGCTSLTVAPELPATELFVSCYSYMLSECRFLLEPPVLPATTLAEECYSFMFRDSGIEVAPELPAMTLATLCYANMFRDCTNLTTAPELPATTLAADCYNHMFNGCTSLTVAPELPATALAERCYFLMFTGSGIRISATQTGIYQTPWRIPTAGTGAAVTDWSQSMLTDTGGTFTGDPSINTTYYQAN